MSTLDDHHDRHGPDHGPPDVRDDDGGGSWAAAPGVDGYDHDRYDADRDDVHGPYDETGRYDDDRYDDHDPYDDPDRDDDHDPYDETGRYDHDPYDETGRYDDHEPYDDPDRDDDHDPYDETGRYDDDRYDDPDRDDDHDPYDETGRYDDDGFDDLGPEGWVDDRSGRRARADERPPVHTTPEERRRLRLRQLAVAGLLAAVALFVGLRLTPNGSANAGDSATYIGVANNLLAGKGATAPFVNEWDEVPPARSIEVVGRSPSALWPPGYSIAIAEVARSGWSVRTAVRILHVGALVALVLATGWLAGRVARGSPAAMLAAGLITCFSPTSQFGVVWVYSDLTAAALSTLAVVALVVLLGRPRAVWGLALALFWMLAAAACLTRLGSVGMVLAAAALLAWRFPARWTGRLVVAAAALSAVVPLGLWRLHVSSTLETGNRSAFTPNQRGDAVVETARTLYHYLVPTTLHDAWAWIRVLVLLALAALVVVRVVERFRQPAVRRPRTDLAARRALVAVLAGYVVATVGAAYAVGALLTVDARTMMSTFPLVVALLVGATATLFARVDRPAHAHRLAGAVPAALVSLVVLIEVVSGWNDFYLRDPVVVGDHLPGQIQDVALARATAPYEVLFSNNPSVLYALTGRSSAPPPALHWPSSLRTNPDHDAQLEDLARILRERGGAYVAFPQLDDGNGIFLSPDDLLDRLDVVPVGGSGAAYVFAPRAPGAPAGPYDLQALLADPERPPAAPGTGPGAAGSSTTAAVRGPSTTR